MVDLHQFIAQQKRDAETFISAEYCKIANTVNDPADKVYVTFPNSESPALREEVAYWRVQFDWDGTNATPRWPTRGQKGLAIYMDTGEIWLIY